MEFVILGFLLIKSLSQYDLFKALSKQVSPFYKPSLGSIQNGLKKLERNGFIAVVKHEGTGRRKNMYSINDLGREYFKKWMTENFSETRFESELSTRLFFLGLLDESEKKSVITNAIEFLEKELKEYKKNEEELAHITITKDYVDIVKYQVKTLELGIYHFQKTLAWLKDFRRTEWKSN